MNVSAATERSLEYIDARAADVMHAYTPGAMPSFDDVGSRDAAAQANLDPMSVALPEGTYIVVRDSSGRTSYTSDGALHIDDGQILDASGGAVAGLSGNGTLDALRIDPVDEALGRVRNVRIEANGELAYERDEIDPRTGSRHRERVVAGRIALARFPSATRLHVVDATHAEAPRGVLPHVGVPGDGNFGTVTPMQRNASRIDFDRSLEKLHDAYVAFDAMSAAHKVQGTLGKTVMDLLK